MEPKSFEEKVQCSDRVSMGLESIADDLIEYEKLGQRWSDAEGTSAQLRMASLTMEAIDPLRTGWAVLVKAADLTSQQFGKAFEQMEIWLDKTGRKELDRLRRRLDQHAGDGNGVMPNKSLARALAVHGNFPHDWGQHTQELLHFSRTVTDRVVPDLANTVRRASAVVRPSAPRNVEEFHADIIKVVHETVAVGGPMELFGREMLEATFCGDRRIFRNRAKPFDYKDHPKIDDADSTKLIDRVNSLSQELAPAYISAHAQPVSVNVPVLSRAEIETMFEYCDALSDEIRRTVALDKLYRKDRDSRFVSKEIDYLLTLVNGKVVEDKASGSKRTTGFEIDSGDKYRAQLLITYYNCDLTRHRRVLEMNTRLLIAVFQTYIEYIESSLAQHRQ